jgi:hypothetical protein
MKKAQLLILEEFVMKIMTMKLCCDENSSGHSGKQVILPVFIVMMSALFFLNTTFAATLNGVFTNDIRQPLSFGSIEFYAAKMDTLVKRVNADTKGIFKVDSVTDGEYKLKIPAHDTFPEQWFSYSGNTRYAQYTLWIGPAMQYDTLKVQITMHPVENPPTSTVLVQVVDTLGQMMKNVSIELLRQPDMRQVGYIYNDTSNLSIFTGVQPGRYAVCVSSSFYPRQYFDTLRNSSTSNYFFPVILNERKTITVKMVMLPSGNGQIRGRCYNEISQPEPGLYVSLYRVKDTLLALYRDTTNDAGNFSFDNILEENFYLQIKGSGYPTQWYSRQRGSTVLYPDDPVWSSSIAAMDTIKIFATANPINNTPASYVKIRAYSPEGTVEKIYGKAALVAVPSQKYTTISIDSTTALYMSPPVSAGLYGLGFSVPGYPYQFYNPNGNTAQDQYHFELTEKETLFIETNLKRTFTDTLTVNYGYVSGSVRDSAGALKGASVTILEKNGAVIASVITDSLGKFKQVRVQNTLMYIRIDAPGYPPQFWVPTGSVPTSNMSAVNFFSVPTMSIMTADVIVTANPQVQQNLDTVKTAITEISGQVNSSAGAVKGVRVMLIENTSTILNGISPQNLWSNFVTLTDSTGKYSFTGIPAGSYLVAVIADTLNFVTQFYKNAEFPKNALSLRIDNGSVTGITFSLRAGGILKGVIVDSSTGSPIEGARMNINENVANGRTFETKSRKDGSWEIRGIPSGEFYTYVNSDLYIESAGEKKSIQIIEGKTAVLDPVRMVKGGIIRGTVALNSISIYDTILRSMHGSLMLFPGNSENMSIMHPGFRTGVQFNRTALDSASVSFVSSVCPVGVYKMVFVPEPVSWLNQKTLTSTEIYRRNLGYSFLNKDTSILTAATITVSSGDTSRNNVIELRNGVSIFGSLLPDSMTGTITNYYVNVYKKYGATLVLISTSQQLGNGLFEIPGLINGEHYFLEMWAEGYPSQFRSVSGKNTTYPVEPMTLDIASGKLQLKISKKPEGTDINNSQYIALWKPVDSNGVVKIRWTTPTSLQMDTFFVYTRNNSQIKQLLTTLTYSSGVTTYEWIDRRTLTGWNEYCVTGRSASMIVRSDIQKYDLREKSVSKGSLWIDVLGSRWGIAIEWGIADTNKFAETDSVILYKRAVGGSFLRHLSRSAWETQLNDWQWSKSDSLKMFEYYVEIPSKGLRSAVKSVTLDNSFFKLLPKEIKVGSGRAYTSIQSAIDVAGDNDNIIVASGLYKEQINLKGKKLNLYGDWNNGYPPVIDASAGTAITIPFVQQSGFDGWIEISGFKLTNAAIGVLVQANANINRCLFTNITKSVKVIPDSAALAYAFIANPFLDKGTQVNIDNCTFIASKSQAFAVSVQSGGVAVSGTTDLVNDRQILFPLKTCNAGSGISKSLFAYYGSIGGLSTLPIQISGASSNVSLGMCAAWQTPVQTSSAAVMVNGDMVVSDPSFKDQVYYLYNDSSKLASLGIGYGIKYSSEDNVNRKDLPCITDLTIFNRSVNKIELRWSAASGSDSVVRYRVFRTPGDASIFYINTDSLWDLISSKNGEFPAELDSFSTDKLSFVDSTIIPGQPYLYAVCAVDKYGNESPVSMPASRPIRSYFTNVFNYTIQVKADVWTMISPWGQAVADFSTSSNVRIYQWDPQKAADKLLSHYVAVTKMVPGNGYWFKSLKDTAITVSVEEPVKLAKVQDTLKCRILKGADGWNQISSPFPHKVNPALPPKYVLWEWMADSSGYKRVSIMEPWKAYWVYTDKDTAFTINSGNNSVSSKSTLAKRTAHASWELVMSLKSRSGIDPENVCGVVSSSSVLSFGGEIPEPPESFSGNYLYFVKNDSSESGTPLRKLSYKYILSDALPDEKIEWTVGIHSAGGPSTITVSGIEQCPSKLGIYWIYKGVIVNLRNNPVITIDSSAQETYGYLVATANPLMLSLYTAAFSLRAPYPNPSSGRVAVDFVLPCQWTESGLRKGDKAQDVSIILYNLSGRVVRTLVNSTIPSGKHTIVWDGRADGGSPVGSGVYILRFKSGKYIRNLQLYRVR